MLSELEPLYSQNGKLNTNMTIESVKSTSYESERKMNKAISLFEKADINNDGKLDIDEIRNYDNEVEIKKTKALILAIAAPLTIIAGVAIARSIGGLRYELALKSSMNAERKAAGLTRNQYKSLKEAGFTKFTQVKGATKISTPNGDTTAFLAPDGRLVKSIRKSRWNNGELITKAQKDGTFAHEFRFKEFFHDTSERTSIKYSGFDFEGNPIKDIARKIEVATSRDNAPLKTRLVLDEAMLKKGDSFADWYFSRMRGGSMPSQYYDGLTFLSPKEALYSSYRPRAEWMKHVCS